MAYNGLVSDFNGTITRTKEEDLNKTIGYRILGDAKKALKRGKLSKSADFIKLLTAKTIAEKNLKRYHEGKRHLWDVYRPFNWAINGKPESYIKGIIDDFVSSSAENIDKGTVDIIKDAHKEGKITGILSVSFDYAIRRALEAAGYNPDEMIDCFACNELLCYDGTVKELTLNIYGEKAEVMEREFFGRKTHMGDMLDEKNTIYIGDTMDDTPVAEILKPGNFVVSLLLDRNVEEDYAFMNKMAREHGAFVPESHKDLRSYLKSR